MYSAADHNWEPGAGRSLDITSCNREYEWLEEPYVSPDGESIAVIAYFEDAQSGLCVNGELWEETFDKIIFPKYTPNGRLTAIVSRDAEWTLAVDQEIWPEYYGFAWDVLFNDSSESIAIAVQQDMAYGMALNGEIWTDLYDNANNFTLSPDGNSTAAVVQTGPLGEANIHAYQQGLYTVAVNGKAWERNFVNVWKPTFDAESKRTAAQVRLNLYDYTIAVDGTPWTNTFSSIWEPVFNHKTGVIAAPVRSGGLWGMARDGELCWPVGFNQCWHQQFSADGSKLAAIVAVKFGKFTVAIEGRPWATTFPVVTDLALSEDGLHAAALGGRDYKWSVMVDDKVWPGIYDRLWPPALTPGGAHAAVKAEKNGKYTIVMDGKEYKEDFSMIWDPIFNPEGDKVLIRGIKDNHYHRIVARLSDF